MLTGTLTILCLDFAESAKLLQFMPSVAGKAVSACNALARQLATEYSAEIHEELALENSLLMAFPLASDCVEAVGRLHRHVLAMPWHPGSNILRSGIITGEVRGGENDADVLLASLRSLTDLARPGQILIGESTHAIVRQKVLEGFGFLNLGLHHLEDGGRGQSLFQLLHADLPSDFQLLPSLLVAASNLPSGGTPFVGRVREIEAVKSGFFYSKVVSLVGFPGVGKSRLAVQVAHEMIEDHYHGASYVDLSTIGVAKQVYQLMATALGVSENPELSIEQAVLEKLRPLEMLILLDNVDPVLGDLPQILTKIVNLCPQVQILTTSRKRFEMPNMHRMTVLPMDAPTARSPGDSSELGKLDSVALFLNRACLVNEHFEMTEQNARLIGSICSRLDGIPLAIELAAAKTGHMGLDKIAMNLDDRFALLGRTKGRKKAPALETAIRWSFDDLSDKHKTVMLRLCSCSGEFPVEMGVKIAGWDPLNEKEVASILPELVGQSYLIQIEHRGQVYLKMLDTIRDFGTNIVIDRGLAVDHMNRFADCFVERARYMSENIYREHQDLILNELDHTYPNYTAALNWTCEVKDDPRPQFLVRALYVYWHQRSMYGEGVRWTEEVLKKNSPSDPAIGAKLHIIAGTLASSAGGYEPAIKHFRKALRLAQRANDILLIMGAHGAAGTTHGFAGDSKAAIAALEKALDASLQVGDSGRIADFRNNLGGALVDAGRHEAAREHLLKALDTYSSQGLTFGIACANFNLGRSHRLCGEFDLATGYLEKALENFFQADNSSSLAATLRELALLRTQVGAYYTAVVLLGAEQRMRDEKKIYIPANRRQEVESALSTLKLRLNSQYAAERQKGYEMTSSQIREFLLLDNTGLPSF